MTHEKPPVGLDFEPFYPEIVNRYIAMLQQAPLLDDPEVGNTHLIWMLETIRDSPEQSHTKKHRWLGYVQCAIIRDHKLTTVQHERDATRAIFNGD